MKYVGYLFLFLLFVYFAFLKPYMLTRGIEIGLEGIGVSLKDRELRLEHFLLYMPDLKGRSLFINLKNVNLKLRGLYVEGIHVLEVSQTVSKEPFDYDFTQLVKLAERINVKVGGVYVSLNSIPERESITVFVGRAEFSKGKLVSMDWSNTFYMHMYEHHQVYVLLREAHTYEGKFLVDDVFVAGDHYFFEGKGVWEGKEGSFQAEGFIKGPSVNTVSVEDINVKGRGKLNYTSLSTWFEAYTPKVLVKGRKSFYHVKAEGSFQVVFGKKKIMQARLSSGQTYASIDYLMSPEGELHAKFKDFPIDRELLGIDSPVYSLLSGDMTLWLKEKRLSLASFSNNLLLLDRSFKKVRLDVSIDYSRGILGKFYLFSTDPVYISVSGQILDKNLEGNISLYMFPYWNKDVSFYVDYTGEISYKDGSFSTSGSGKLTKVVYRNVPIGGLSFSLNLKDSFYNVSFNGVGFNGGGKGSLRDGSFRGGLNFEGFSSVYNGFEFYGLNGSLIIDLHTDRIKASGRLDGNVSKDGISLSFHSKFDLDRERELNGKFTMDISNIRRGDFAVSHVMIRGTVEQGLLKAYYSIQDYAKGEFRYHLTEGYYSMEGNYRRDEKQYALNLLYTLHGKGKDFSAHVVGKGRYETYTIPIDVSLGMSSGKTTGEVKGFSIKLGFFNISVGDMLLEGSDKQGSIEFKGATVSTNSSSIFKVEASRGTYSIEKWQISFPNILFSGGVRASSEILYQKDKGIFISSVGSVNLGELMTLFKSRVLTYGVGQISYTFEKKEKLVRLRIFSPEDIELRSRFLALPLRGRVFALYDGNTWEGSANFKENNSYLKVQVTGNGKIMELTFKAESLPILYRSDNIRMSGSVSISGSLTTDYRRLSVKSKVDLGGVNLNIKSTKGKPLEKSELYKLVNMDVRLYTTQPVRVNIPEGYVYTHVEGNLLGTLYEPDYSIKLNLSSGTLKYFNKEFYMRRGSLTLTSKETLLDVSLISPSPDYNILIDIKGDTANPKAFVRSEPPKETREVITSLVLGGGEGEGIFSLSSALIAQFPEFSRLMQGVEKAVGTDVKLSVSSVTSSTGEVGVKTKVSKDITKRLNVEYQKNTVKDPKETYGGVDVKLSPNTSVGARVYSDRSKEFKLRFRKKFDF
ncbi:MAG: translocation/assembly module TamB domain-containing protein [Aquificaceae bacterium]